MNLRQVTSHTDFKNNTYHSMNCKHTRAAQQCCSGNSGSPTMAPFVPSSALVSLKLYPSHTLAIIFSNPSENPSKVLITQVCKPVMLCCVWVRRQFVKDRQKHNFSLQEGEGQSPVCKSVSSVPASLVMLQCR